MRHVPRRGGTGPLARAKTAIWPPSPSTASWPGAALTRCARSIPGCVRHACLSLITAAGIDGRPRLEHQGLRGQLLQCACKPAPLLNGLVKLTRPAAPTGGRPISIVVADDTSLVEHPGGAGAPIAGANRPRPAVEPRKVAPDPIGVLTAGPYRKRASAGWGYEVRPHPGLADLCRRRRGGGGRNTGIRGGLDARDARGQAAAGGTRFPPS